MFYKKAYDIDTIVLKTALDNIKAKALDESWLR